MVTEPKRQDLDVVGNYLAAYADKRVRFYLDTKLDRLLTKDVVMYALRGVKTADQFIDHAFAAYESSSEEGVMANTWQAIIKELSRPAVIEAGDLLAERDGALWIIEVKSQENTFNADSLAQAVRKLKNRVAYHSTFHTSGPKKPVKAMIGILRGPDIDEVRTYRMSRTRTENQDIEGTDYRYVVGRPFWRFLTGRSSVNELLGDYSDVGERLGIARASCMYRLRAELNDRLHARGLPDSIEGVIRLTYESDI